MVRRADSEEAIRKGESGSECCEHMYVSGNTSAFSAAVSPCLSFASLLIFSEQFVLTGKCHATLSALTPSPLCHPPSLSFSLSISPSSHFSSATRRVAASSLPSLHILSSPFFFFFLPSLLNISSPPLVRLRLSSTASAIRGTQC